MIISQVSYRTNGPLVSRCGPNYICPNFHQSFHGFILSLLSIFFLPMTLFCCKLMQLHSVQLIPGKAEITGNTGM